MVQASESASFAVYRRNAVPPATFYRAVEAFWVHVSALLVSPKIVGASKCSLTFGKHTTIRFGFVWSGGGRTPAVASNGFCSVSAFLEFSMIVIVSTRSFPFGRSTIRKLSSEWCRGGCRPLKGLKSHLYGKNLELGYKRWIWSRIEIATRQAYFFVFLRLFKYSGAVPQSSDPPSSQPGIDRSFLME